MARRTHPKRLSGLALSLTRSFVLISFVILIISTGLEMYFGIVTQRAGINNEQTLIATSAASDVSHFISDKLQGMDQAATFNDLATQEGRRDLVLNKLLGRDPSLMELYLLDKDGTIIKDVTRRPAVSTSTLEKYGHELLSTTLNGDVYISPVYFEENNSEPLILIAIPTKDIFHDIKGVFVAEVDLKFMLDLITQVKVGKDGLAYVIDRKGNLVAFRDISRVLKHENLSDLDEVSAFRQNAVSAGLIHKGILGNYVVTRFVPLGTPDWAVVVELPITEAFAPILQVLGFSLLVILLSMIFAGVYAVYLARGIARPIQRLIATADAIAAGDFSKRAAIDSNDEVGHLAESFNTMADKLHGLYDTQDKTIQEKTKELLEQVTEGERSKSAILNLLEDIEDEKQKVQHVVDIRTKELSAEKTRLLASINSLSFGFVLADAFDHIIVQNPALKKILGFEKEPETIRDLAELFNTDGSKVNIDITGTCKRCMELKEPVEFKEVSFAKKFLRIICSPILSETGAIGYIFIVEDITEAKVMERSREEFFAVASHELRTPLTAIRGNSEMLLELYSAEIPNGDMREMLSDINSASVRLIELVNDFLEVSRLEQGRVEVHRENFDMREIIERVVRNLKGTIEKKGVALVFEEPQMPLPANSDKNRVEQILINLVGNATKFTKEGSITIRSWNEGGKIHVQVTDTGIGISQENQVLLFRKFQQAGEKMLARDVTQGTGLGLYICKLILELLDGEIALDKSELGKGSTFSFSVPSA